MARLNLSLKQSKLLDFGFMVVPFFRSALVVAQQKLKEGRDLEGDTALSRKVSLVITGFLLRINFLKLLKFF